jgi:hypothetical protein
MVEIINALKKELKKELFETSHTDGRVNSSISEKYVLSVLEQHFEITLPRHREWFDFKYQNIPINIKITDLSKKNQADNLNCKLGIYHSFTNDKEMKLHNEISWNLLIKKLFDNFEETENDYYFLIINKKNPEDCFFNSLKKIQTLIPNGNNLPFQCQWEKNRIPFERTFEESKTYIFSMLEKSLELRASPYQTFLDNQNIY